MDKFSIFFPWQVSGLGAVYVVVFLTVQVSFELSGMIMTGNYIFH